MTLSISDNIIVDSDHSLNNLTGFDATSTTTIRNSIIANTSGITFDTFGNLNNHVGQGAVVFTTDTNELYIYDSASGDWISTTTSGVNSLTYEGVVISNLKTTQPGDLTKLRGGNLTAAYYNQSSVTYRLGGGVPTVVFGAANPTVTVTKHHAPSMNFTLKNKKYVLIPQTEEVGQVAGNDFNVGYTCYDITNDDSIRLTHINGQPYGNNNLLFFPDTIINYMEPNGRCLVQGRVRGNVKAYKIPYTFDSAENISSYSNGFTVTNNWSNWDEGDWASKSMAFGSDPDVSIGNPYRSAILECYTDYGVSPTANFNTVYNILGVRYPKNYDSSFKTISADGYEWVVPNNGSYDALKAFSGLETASWASETKFLVSGCQATGGIANTIMKQLGAVTCCHIDTSTGTYDAKAVFPKWNRRFCKFFRSSENSEYLYMYSLGYGDSSVTQNHDFVANPAIHQFDATELLNPTTTILSSADSICNWKYDIGDSYGMDNTVTFLPGSEHINAAIFDQCALTGDETFNIKLPNSDGTYMFIGKLKSDKSGFNTKIIYNLDSGLDSSGGWANAYQRHYLGTEVAFIGDGLIMIARNSPVTSPYSYQDEYQYASYVEKALTNVDDRGIHIIRGS